MAKKKDVTDENITEIKKLLKTKDLIIGEDRTIKNLRLGKIDKVFLTSNCPKGVVEDINYYAKLAKSHVVKLSQNNEELGVVCKKPFAISVLSCLKGQTK